MSRRRSKLAKKYKSRKNPDIPKAAKRKARRTRGYKLRRHYKTQVRHEIHRNPSGVDWASLGITVGYGFGGFALSRFATRVASVQVAKRSEKWAPHAGVVAGLLTFLAAVFLAKRSKHTAPHAETLQIGTGLALAQTVLQTYIPKLGWIVSDCAPEVAAAAAPAQVATPTSAGSLLPDDDDDDNWGTYNDAFDHGRHSRDAQPRQNARQRPITATAPQATRNATQATGPAPSPDGSDDDVDSILAELDDDNLGVFTN